MPLLPPVGGGGGGLGGLGGGGGKFDTGDYEPLPDDSEPPVVPPTQSFTFPLEMLLAEVSYIAPAAGQKAYTITFAFILPEHVHVSVDDEEVTDFTIDPSKTVVTLGASVTITGGELVRIYRQTPNVLEGLLVQFVSGAAITQDELNLATTQLLYIAQEADDRGQRAVELLQTAQIAAGSLPSVDSGDNNKGLFVTAGTWQTRTPAQCRAHLQLADRAITPFVEAWALFTVTADHAVIQDTAASWRFRDTAKLPLSALSQFHVNGTDIAIASGGNDIVLRAPGKYLIEISGHLGSPNSACVVAWALTNEKNDSSVTIYKDTADAGMTFDGTLPINCRHLLDVTAETFVALRAVKRAGGLTAFTRSPFQILVTRIRD